MASTQRAACLSVPGLSISSETGIGMALTAVNPRSMLRADALGEVLGIGGPVHAFQSSAAQVVVIAQRVANRSAKQLADRLAGLLALDVPKRLVDAADGGHAGNAVAPEVLAMHDLPEMFDAPRVLADQQDREILDRSGDALRLPLQRRFAPAPQAGFAGLYLDEDPVAHARIDHHRGNSRDTHLSTQKVSGIGLRNSCRQLRVAPCRRHPGSIKLSWLVMVIVIVMAPRTFVQVSAAASARHHR